LLSAADIQPLGWKKLRSVSPWETYRLNNFLLSVFPDGNIQIKYYIYFGKDSGMLFKGSADTPERLTEIMNELKIK